VVLLYLPQAIPVDTSATLLRLQYSDFQASCHKVNDVETQFPQEKQMLGSVIVIIKWNIHVCLVGCLSLYKQILFDIG
jgi:hypothetical protein